jgi:4-amino-4-deoxy-L-arabinose transferase-like glycosyltransferase
MSLLKREKRSWLPIGVISIFAVAVRLWGIDFGLPYAYHVDEPRYLHSAVGIIQSGNLNPGWFYQPSLYIYLITVIISSYYLFGRSIGQFQSTDELFRPPYSFDGQIELPVEFLLARLLTVFFGVSTILLIYYVARRWMGKAGAIVSALLLAVSIFHVQSSHFIATDVPVAFFIILTLFAAGRIVDGGKPWHYVMAGLAIGLAVGTKYSAYVIVVPVLMAHLIAWRKGTTNLISTDLLWLGLVALITYTLTTPYSLLDSSQFIEDILYEWRHHKVVGHIGAEGDTAWWLVTRLWNSSDRWVTVAAFIGFALGIWKREWKILLVLGFALTYFLSMASNLVRFERFLVPLIPALALAAGYAFAVTFKQWPTRNVRIALIILLVLMLIEPVTAIIQTDRTLAQNDVRTVARAWIRDNIPPGSKIARETYAPNLDGMGYEVNSFSRLNENSVSWYEEQGFDYLIFAQARYGNIFSNPDLYADQIANYEALFDNLELVTTLTGSYVDRPNHDILIYRSVP